LSKNVPTIPKDKWSPDEFAKATQFTITNDELKDPANYTKGPPPGKFRTNQHKSSASSIGENNFKLLMTAWSDTQSINPAVQERGKKYFIENVPKLPQDKWSPDEFAKATQFTITNDELKDPANYTEGPPPGKFRTIKNNSISSQ
jgi:hypothetical protein